jgi:hypothetical protein
LRLNLGDVAALRLAVTSSQPALVTSSPASIAPIIASASTKDVWDVRHVGIRRTRYR